ncbi:hypothetical protein ACOMHN_010946 [Nucella lapillus]
METDGGREVRRGEGVWKWKGRGQYAACRSFHKITSRAGHPGFYHGSIWQQRVAGDPGLDKWRMTLPPIHLHALLQLLADSRGRGPDGGTGIKPPVIAY